MHAGKGSPGLGAQQLQGPLTLLVSDKEEGDGVGERAENRGHQLPSLSPVLPGALPLPSRNQGKPLKKVPCEPLTTAWLWPYFCQSIKIEKNFKKDF